MASDVVDVLMWVVLLATLIGTIANVKKLRWCFLVWICTNIAWATYDYYKVAYAQVALNVVFIGMSIWGWHAWAETQPKESEGTKRARQIAEGSGCEVTLFYLGKDKFRITGRWPDTQGVATIELECDPVTLSVGGVIALLEEARSEAEKAGV